MPVRYKDQPSRADSSVAAVTFAVFDLDEPTPDQLATLGAALDGTTYVMHQTHRGNGYRLVMPLESEIPADDFPAVWQATVDHFKIPADPTCKNLGRIYFQPTRPAGAEYQTYTGAGRPFDWRKLDLVFPGGPESALLAFKNSVLLEQQIKADSTDPRNLRPADEPMNLDEMRAAAKAMRSDDSRAMLNTILGGRRITENWPTDIGFRDIAIQQAVSVLATTPRGKPYPWSTVYPMLAPCVAAMDCRPEGPEHWIEEAREKYARAVGRRLERDARTEADRAALMRIVQGPPKEGGGGAPDNWRGELIPTIDKEGEVSGLKQCGANANTVLRYDAGWLNHLRFNEITKEIDVFGGPLEHAHKATLDTEASNWLARSEYRLSLSTQVVGEQLLAVARKNTYDPLREELLALKWDGRDRVTSFFEDYFGAWGDVDHIQRISACFLISCAARALDPGCEVHTVPILVSEGKQGVGKSRSLRALGGKYFTDTKMLMGDKDSRMLAASTWIIELAELASIRGAEIEQIKGFISQPDDKIRPPYGRVLEVFKRRCVFVGTSNISDILSDWTGERRYWPINVKFGAVDRIKKDRDQILAQAVVLYQQGIKWWLTDFEADRAEEVARAFKRPSGVAEHILQWFVRKPPNERPRELTNSDLITLVFGAPMDRVTDKLKQDVGHAMRELKFVHMKKRLADRQVWVYVTPQDILMAKREERPTSDLQLAVNNAVAANGEKK